MTQNILNALILGLIAGVIPGPVLAAIFTEILQSGFGKSIRIILWAMFTELSVALFSLIILSAFGFPESFFRALSFVGAGVLVWIATSIWKIQKIDTGEQIHFGVGKIASMIIANGVLWTFWITVCIPKAITLGDQIVGGQFLFLGIVEIGWLLSTMLVAIIFSRFRTLLSKPKVVPYMFKLFALTFVYFAGDMVYKSVTYFVH